MKQMQFAVTINAPRQKVWDILWQNETLQQWAGIIDPGTYMEGDLKVGNEVQFISAENGYGVTSLVAELTPGEFLLLKHQADTQNSGAQQREKEWTGGEESYLLKENEGATTLTAAFGVPENMEEYFAVHYPKALAKVKELAESGNN